MYGWLFWLGFIYLGGVVLPSQWYGLYLEAREARREREAIGR